MLLGAAIAFEHMTSPLFLFCAAAGSLLLIFGVAWIFRLRKRERKLEAVVSEVRRNHRELLGQNDLLTAEV